MMISSFSLCLLGLCLLSLATKRNRKNALPNFKKLTTLQTRILKCVGFACLITSALVLAAAKGLSLGLVYLGAWVTLAALAQALLLSYRPRGVPSLLAASLAAVIISVALRI